MSDKLGTKNCYFSSQKWLGMLTVQGHVGPVWLQCYCDNTCIYIGEIITMRTANVYFCHYFQMHMEQSMGNIV